jgi:hypothetical protein
MSAAKIAVRVATVRARTSCRRLVRASSSSVRFRGNAINSSSTRPARDRGRRRGPRPRERRAARRQRRKPRASSRRSLFLPSGCVLGIAAILTVVTSRPHHSEGGFGNPRGTALGRRSCARAHPPQDAAAAKPDCRRAARPRPGAAVANRGPTAEKGCAREPDERLARAAACQRSLRHRSGGGGPADVGRGVPQSVGRPFRGQEREQSYGPGPVGAGSVPMIPTRS